MAKTKGKRTSFNVPKVPLEVQSYYVKKKIVLLFQSEIIIWKIFARVGNAHYKQVILFHRWTALESSYREEGGRHPLSGEVADPPWRSAVWQILAWSPTCHTANSILLRHIKFHNAVQQSSTFNFYWSQWKFVLVCHMDIIFIKHSKIHVYKFKSQNCFFPAINYLQYYI